jgi:hypothetical protein
MHNLSILAIDDNYSLVSYQPNVVVVVAESDRLGFKILRILHALVEPFIFLHGFYEVQVLEGWVVLAWDWLN